MQDFEVLGLFYLGRYYEMQNKQPQPGLLLYDSKDLVTHAVCVGMTGSGKTGLCLNLLEEAAIDGVPALVIDPKGDLSNLLLTFPELRADDFLPWINEDDARRKGVSAQAFAAEQAEKWKAGLAEWGQTGMRIAKLRESAEFAIYTPGSNAGIPISIVKSFAAPEAAILEDNELFRGRIQTTVTSLLGLLGISADPIKSREHILLSNILDTTWRQGQNMDLGALIQQIQNPPMKKVGVMDLESFYPAKERFELAMALNNLLAAPGFNSWMEGEPLDIQSLLYTPQGKPKVSIISIAHLSDSERMFFVSLLLNQTLGWMRTQSGTTSLRAILYMDEIFGYFPPVANPPSKQPLLTLLKQARAFGLGIVLATQNPVDLDYKGLANTGTWFIGRLQTERDKMRVLEGLEGAAATTGAKFDRQKMEQILAGLGNRVFLMNNVHNDAPVVFQTRWSLSYLRGPLGRDQIKKLMSGKKPGTSAPTASTAPSNTASPTTAAPAPVATNAPSAGRPVLPPEVQQFFVPVRSGQPAGSKLVYQPVIFGAAQLRFADSKAKIDVSQDLVRWTAITNDPIPVNWDQGLEADCAVSDLEKTPQENSQFLELPSVANKAKNYDAWSKDFSNWLFRGQKLELFKSSHYKTVSSPDENERDFRVRLQLLSREERDQAVEKLRQKYAPKIATLEDRIRRAQQNVQKEKSQATQQKLQTALSFGATLLGAFLGRKAVSAGNIGKATTAMRGVGRSMKESQDIGRAEENVGALHSQLEELQTQFKQETGNLEMQFDPTTETLETLTLKPSKTNISVRLAALCWVPYWKDSSGTLKPAF